MLADNIEKILNTQLNEEIYSSNLYLSLSSYLETKNLRGMASWMRSQSKQEHDHMMRFYDYLIDRGGCVITKKIPGPPIDWDSPIAAFGAAFEHEKKLSRHIGKMADMAQKEEDHATYNFLQWFINKQSEEEASFRTIIGQMTLIGDDPHGMLMLDRELGKGDL
jgi:ferritin